MNHLVYLDAQAGELEKVLSRIKTMLVRESDPAQAPACAVNPGDCLYFLREQKAHVVQVKAVVVRVLNLTAEIGSELSHALKELQPKLQLTEEQYNTWSVKKQLLLVEFESAQKTGMIKVSQLHITNKSNWVAFEDFSQIT